MTSPSDPRYDGFRIASLWAWTVVDPKDNQEGIPAIQLGDTMLPLVGSDRVRMEALRVYAQRVATSTKAPVRLRRFVPDETDPLEELHP